MIKQTTKTKQEEEKKFFSKLADNKKLLKEIFKDVDDITYRHIILSDQKGNKLNALLVYIDEMIDKKVINDSILEPLLSNQYRCKAVVKDYTHSNVIKDINEKILNTADAEVVQSVERATRNILRGQSLLLLDESNKVLSIGTEGWEEKKVGEPTVERTVRGPQTAFTENSEVNIGLVRRIIINKDLKVETFFKGRYTHTKINVLYLKGVASDSIVNEVKKRIKNINVADLHGCQHVNELIQDNPFTPFNTIYETQRPDTIAAGILEGRVAILTDNCPTGLLAPKLFMENLISPEDYYSNYIYTFAIRGLRLLAFFISTLLPSIYVATLSYHQSVIPRTLIRTVYASREGVPFPILIEMLLFLFFFETIREAGARIPTNLSTAVSIVGALILGQTAVQAGFLSADGVIVGSLTGMAIFLAPVIEFSQALLFLRYLFLIAAGIAGYYGIALVLILVTAHLCSLRSFGVPYMSPVAPLQLKDLKDFFLRVPYYLMNTRPESLETQDLERQGNRPIRKFFFKYKPLKQEGQEEKKQ